MPTTSSPGEWLTMIRVDRDYAFEDGGRRKALRELFDDDRLLVVYHFPFDAGWEQAGGCSHLAEGLIRRLQSPARRVAFAAVSRAPYGRIAACRRRLGWTFRWLSSLSDDFEQDFPTISVFLHQGSQVFHASSTPAALSAVGLLDALDEAPLIDQRDRHPPQRAGGMSSAPR